MTSQHCKQGKLNQTPTKEMKGFCALFEFGLAHQQGRDTTTT